MEFKTTIRYLRMSPRKVRLVADLMRGKEVGAVQNELEHTRKASSLPLLKLLKSAIANVKHNFELSEKGLYIKEIRVDGGPMLKRFRPRAFGRAATIRKRTSHVTLILVIQELKDKSWRKKAAKEEILEENIREVELDEARKGGLKDHSRGEEKALDAKRPSVKSGFIKKVFSRKVV